MATYTIDINSVERDILIESVDLRLVSRQISTLSFDIAVDDASYQPEPDDIVRLLESGTPIFYGYLTDVDEAAHGDNVAIDEMVLRCTAVEIKGALSFDVVTGTFAAGSLESQLTTLVAQLTEYGITLHPSQITGPTMPEVIVDGMRADQFLEQLVSTASGLAGTGYAAEVTPVGLYLNVYDVTARLAPYNLLPTGTARQVGDIRVQKTKDDNYGTTVILTVNGRGSATSTDSFVAADGVSAGGFTRFAARYPSTQSLQDIWPNVLRFDGVTIEPIMFGVENLVTNGGVFRWAWDYTTSPAALVYDEATLAPFPTTETIEVTYAIRYPFTVTATAGSPLPGLPRTVIRSTDQPLPYEAAQALAESLLLGIDGIIVKVRAQSDDVGWRPGTTVTVNEPKRGLPSDTDCVIDEVVMAMVPGSDVMRHSITAVAGVTAVGNWRETPIAWLGGGGDTVATSVTGVSGDSHDYFMTFEGNPQGVVVAVLGTVGLDLATGRHYKKAAGNGNTGWYPVTDYGVTSEHASSLAFSARFSPDGNLPRVLAIGMSPSIYSGTNTAMNRYADGMYATYSHSSGTGSRGGIFLPTAFADFLEWDLYDFDVRFTLRTDTTQAAGFRYYIGWVTVDPPNSDTITGRCIMFRYSSVLPDGGWVGVTNDNTGQSITSTIAAIAVDTKYILRIRKVGTTAYFSVDDGPETVVTSKVPNDTTKAYLTFCSVISQTNPRQLSFRSMGGMMGTYS